MNYLIAFLEGIITFISPCLLPMLPIYISYFAGGNKEIARGGNSQLGECVASEIDSPVQSRALKNSIGFVLGFTAIFVIMGAFAGVLGGFLREYQTVVNIVSGLVVIGFGLNFLGVFEISIFRGMKHSNKAQALGFFSAISFGMVFSIGWTPCVGAFLGSALALASQQGSVTVGIFMLLSYSLGLGIPFILSALLIDRLKFAFDFIKRNYKIINTISGSLLVAVGLFMMTGLMGYLLKLLSF